MVAFFEWQKNWWLQRARDWVWTSQPDDRAFAHGNDYVKGHVTYAKQQAEICVMLLERCKEAWKDMDLYLNLGEKL